MPSFAVSGPRRFLVSATLAAAALTLPACLEGSATTADGGADGAHATSTSGASNTGSSGGSGSSHASGTSGSGSSGTGSTTSGATGVSGMDAGGLLPVCKNPTGLVIACNDCVESMCVPDVAPVLSACASFYTCYEACDCSDSACIMACQKAAPAGCDTPATNLIDCQMMMCAKACSPPDAGSDASGSDATTGSDAGATCKNPTATQLACGRCEEMSCASTVASEKSMCGSFNACFEQCACSSTSCLETCYEAAGSACQTVLGQLDSCQTGTCMAACSGTATDGGTTTDGGMSTSGIPDCKNPTSGEAALYASCSACDDQNCAMYVTAAVSACSAYYACFGSTDCSSAADCDGDITSDCQVAIDDLAGCQGFVCAADCD
jgi:hypothetical protein